MKCRLAGSGPRNDSHFNQILMHPFSFICLQLSHGHWPLYSLVGLDDVVNYLRFQYTLVCCVPAAHRCPLKWPRESCRYLIRESERCHTMSFNQGRADNMCLDAHVACFEFSICHLASKICLSVRCSCYLDRNLLISIFAFIVLVKWAVHSVCDFLFIFIFFKQISVPLLFQGDMLIK